MTRSLMCLKSHWNFHLLITRTLLTCISRSLITTTKWISPSQLYTTSTHKNIQTTSQLSSLLSREVSSSHISQELSLLSWRTAQIVSHSTSDNWTIISTGSPASLVKVYQFYLSFKILISDCFIDSVNWVK